ncbi:hypothetical protein SLE2022_330110 [Rubroshorea leprosula]
MGRWISGCACKIGYTSSLRAELWGIREGLLLTHQRNIQNSIVEIDSLVAAQLLFCCISSHHPFYSLILDCREILSRIPRITIQHVYKKANLCADTLTAVAHSQSVDFVSFDYCPPGLLLYQEADMMGTYFPRPLYIICVLFNAVLSFTKKKKERETLHRIKMYSTQFNAWGIRKTFY